MDIFICCMSFISFHFSCDIAHTHCGYYSSVHMVFLVFVRCILRPSHLYHHSIVLSIPLLADDFNDGIDDDLVVVASAAVNIASGYGDSKHFVLSSSSSVVVVVVVVVSSDNGHDPF